MLETVGIVRKVDELGRIVLPADVRTLLDIQVNDQIEVLVDKENYQVVLQKAVPVCLKCKSKENLREICPNYYLCKTCIDSLK